LFAREENFYLKSTIARKSTRVTWLSLKASLLRFFKIYEATMQLFEEFADNGSGKLFLHLNLLLISQLWHSLPTFHRGEQQFANYFNKVTDNEKIFPVIFVFVNTRRRGCLLFWIRLEIGSFGD